MWTHRSEKLACPPVLVKPDEEIFIGRRTDRKPRANNRLFRCEPVVARGWRLEDEEQRGNNLLRQLQQTDGLIRTLL